MSIELERRQFLAGATLVEGGLIVLALGLAWALDIPLGELIAGTSQAIVWGVGAAVPLAAVFLLTYYRPWGGFRRMKDFLFTALGPPIAACRWYELLWVAALAGIGEELVFRGVLQTWLHQWGEWQSLLVTNIVFGLCHAITPTYTLMAFLMGLLLSGLMEAPGEPNLLTPILTHGLYDFIAFSLIARDWRKHHSEADNAETEPAPSEPDNPNEF